MGLSENIGIHGHLRTQGERIYMQQGTAIRSETVAADIQSLFVVSLENPLFTGDEPFFVAVFSGFLWVIPEDTHGLRDFIQAVAPRLEETRAVYRAVSPPRPWRWRRRVLGFLPLFPTPALGCHPLSSKPDWTVSEPLRPSEVEELAMAADGPGQSHGSVEGLDG